MKQGLLSLSLFFFPTLITKLRKRRRCLGTARMSSISMKETQGQGFGDSLTFQRNVTNSLVALFIHCPGGYPLIHQVKRSSICMYCYSCTITLDFRKQAQGTHRAALCPRWVRTMPPNPEHSPSIISGTQMNPHPFHFLQDK